MRVYEVRQTTQLRHGTPPQDGKKQHKMNKCDRQLHSVLSLLEKRYKTISKYKCINVYICMYTVIHFQDNEKCVRFVRCGWDTTFAWRRKSLLLTSPSRRRLRVTARRLEGKRRKPDSLGGVGWDVSLLS